MNKIDLNIMKIENTKLLQDCRVLDVETRKNQENMVAITLKNDNGEKFILYIDFSSSYCVMIPSSIGNVGKG